jgi:uridylate kinase
MSKPQYSRIVLKLSGEVMMGDLDFGVDIDYMRRFAAELVELSKQGVEILVEVGGGNIYRWRSAGEGMQRNTGDMMGMLGSVMTALNFRDVINEIHAAEALSQIYMPYAIDYYTPKKADEYLQNGKIVVMGGGSGQQFFTTDFGAAVHASHVGAEILLKATNVDGVYDKDPSEFEDAQKYEKVSYSEALEKKLTVMDMPAFALLRDAHIPVMVFDVREEGSITKAVMGENIGTIVS